MMRISFNQKQEDIWSTRGHRLPSGPRRKSPVMSMGVLHANSGGTATPRRTQQGGYQEGLPPSLGDHQGQPGHSDHSYTALCWLLQVWTPTFPLNKKKEKPNMVFYAHFLSLPSDGQESCEVWSAQPPLPQYWHQSVVILCLQTVPRTALPHTYNDLEIMVQEATLQSLLLLGRSS